MDHIVLFRPFARTAYDIGVQLQRRFANVLGGPAYGRPAKAAQTRQPLKWCGGIRRRTSATISSHGDRRIGGGESSADGCLVDFSARRQIDMANSLLIKSRFHCDVDEPENLSSRKRAANKGSRLLLCCCGRPAFVETRLRFASLFAWSQPKLPKGSLCHTESVTCPARWAWDKLARGLVDFFCPWNYDRVCHVKLSKKSITWSATWNGNVQYFDGHFDFEWQFAYFVFIEDCVEFKVLLQQRVSKLSADMSQITAVMTRYD